MPPNVGTIIAAVEAALAAVAVVAVAVVVFVVADVVVVKACLEKQMFSFRFPTECCNFGQPPSSIKDLFLEDVDDDDDDDVGDDVGDDQVLFVDDD